MSKWLSQEWLDETRKMAEGQPERAGASARMQYVVTGAPDGDIDYYWVLENGKISESQLGRLDDAEVTLTTGLRRRPQDPEGRARRQRRVHAGQGEGDREHGQGHVSAAHHELARVQATPDRDRGDHRVLSHHAAPPSAAFVRGELRIPTA